MLTDILGAYVFIGIVFTGLFIISAAITLMMRADGDDVYANNKALRNTVAMLIFGWTWPVLAVWYLIFKPVHYAYKSFREALSE